MKIEIGKSYRTRSGKKATVLQREEAEHYIWCGTISYATGAEPIASWTESGFYMNSLAPDDHDLIADWVEPYECWMIQGDALDAVPVPNEEIARAWAKKTEGGRAFRMVEVME